MHSKPQEFQIMVFAFSGISDPRKRIEWTLVGQENARWKPLVSESQTVEHAKSDSPTNEAVKPKIVHLLEGGSAVSSEPLVQLLLRQLAHKYRFASICIGISSSQPEGLGHGGLPV